jgi:excisionase family DNA binding protein
MRASLESVLALAKILAPEELPRLLGDLEEIRVTALARLASPVIEARPDELLSVEEASKRMGVSRGYLYRHHPQLNFSRRAGRKLLFSSVGLDSYLKKSR